MIRDGYIEIPHPVALVLLCLLMLFAGGMIGAGSFQIHEKEPCLIERAHATNR